MIGSHRSRIAVAVLVVLGLLAFSFVYLQPMWERKQIVESGEAVNATVVSAETRRENTRSSQPDYYTSIEYRYTVDGQEYTSTRIVPGPRLSNPHGYRQAIIPHEPGDEITVYYDTENPEYAWVTTIDSRVSARGGQLTFVGMAIAVLLAYIEAERTVARQRQQFHGDPSGIQRVGQYSGAVIRALGVLAVGVIASFAVNAAIVNVLLAP